MKITKNAIKFHVDTVDELANLPGEDKQVCIVSDKDRGGVFVYDSSKSNVNDGGTVFNGWVRQYDGAVNVKWFGAKGDGVNDDTLSIKQAINSSNYINFPEGVYKITDTLYLKPNLILKGKSRVTASNEANVIIEYYGNGVCIQALKDSGNQYLDDLNMIEIEGITIKDINNTGTIGFDLQGFRWSTLKNCAIEGFNIGLHTFQCWFSKISSIFIQNWRDKGIWAEGLDNNILWENIKLGSDNGNSDTLGALFYGITSGIINVINSEAPHGSIKIDNCKSLQINGLYFETKSTDAQSYALLIASSNTISINNAYINGNNVVEKGIYHGDLSLRNTISNSYIIKCATSIYDSSYGKELLVTNSNTDVPFEASCGIYGNRRIVYNRFSAPPTSPTGNWNKGDIVLNKNVIDDGIIGWVCIESGTPGTWKSIGKIGNKTLEITDETNLSTNALITKLSDSNGTYVKMYGLPTSDPNDAGRLWVDTANGHVIKVSQG
jgi:hypothetical protein